MSTQAQTVCAAAECGVVIPDDAAAYTILFGEKEGEPICEGCAEYDTSEHVSAVTRYCGAARLTVRYGDYLAEIWVDGHFIDQCDSLDDLPEWFTEHFGGRDYVRSDAWRGHYENKGRGLAKVCCGWVTGYPDDSVRHKQPSIDLSVHLSIDKKPAPDFPVYWAFDPTSNLFSTASDIYVEEGREGAFDSWLREHLGFNLETLARAFE